VVQGKHNAVRSLVELSILKLIGRHLEIPYWRCLPDGKEDPDVIEMMKADFRNQRADARIGTVQLLLKKCGYNVDVNGTADQITQTAIRNFRTKHGGDLRIDENLYADLMLSVPMPFSGGKPAASPASYPYPAPAPAYEQAKSASSPLSFQTAFVCRPGGTGKPAAFSNRATLRSGDYYKIIVKPDEDCYLYVFQADSSGQFYQLFPVGQFKGVTINSTNPLQRCITRTIPADDKSFVLDRKTGTERICIAASRTRNRELENLYAEITRAGSQEQAMAASRQMGQYFSRQRGVAAVVSDEPLQVQWKESGDIFSVISQRLEKVCKDCVYVMEFYHR